MSSHETADSPFDVRDFETLARERLPRDVFDYIALGAGDNITLRENEAGWSSLRLRPRVLIDVSSCEFGTTILGQPVSLPLMLAPCAVNAMVHPDGELGVARAAAAAGIIQVVSVSSGSTWESIAAASGGLRWAQLYCLRDRSITRSLVERAERAGYRALCLTVDVPTDGIRHHNTRNNFSMPPAGFDLANFAEPLDLPLHLQNRSWHDPSLAWKTLEWLREISKLPIVIKGILAPDDARIAVGLGAQGIVVSNHGGRQLDTAISTQAALRPIADEVAGRLEIYVDGGIRRGTDVLKALALGARAVLIGRPYLWGLAIGGEAGVSSVLEIVRDEFRIAMTLTGCRTVSEVQSGLIS